MPRLMASRYLSIVQDGTADFKDPAKVIGTGPFTVADFTPAERTTLARNDTLLARRHALRRRGRPHLHRPRGAAQRAPLRAGRRASRSSTAAQRRQQESQGKIQVVVIPGASVPNFTMRLDTKPFDDPKVREAFRLSIDRQKMVDTIFLGDGVVGNDLHGLAYPSYNKDLPQRAYDPERAKSLLAEAGHADGLEVELITGLFVPDATAFAEQAKESGINIKLKRVTPDEVYNTDLYYLKAPFGETSWGADSFEFIAPQGLFANAPYNETAWKRPDWDTAVQGRRRHARRGCPQRDLLRPAGGALERGRLHHLRLRGHALRRGEQPDGPDPAAGLPVRRVPLRAALAGLDRIDGTRA